MKQTFFSIIIPVKKINDYIKKGLPYLLSQKYPFFEIIILPDSYNNELETNNKIRIIETGSCGPAVKRDIGMKNSKGDILAFIDDDAYPEGDWLINAVEYFKENNLAALGGPNITPPDSNYFQKISGYALSSPLVSGPVTFRYRKAKERVCDDLPSCNLFVRKKVFKDVGGFDTSFWPGEDTKLCLEIKKTGKKILYSPKVSVYHYRRSDLKGYLNQIGTYALHRGYFARKYPETSLRVSYFIPSIFVLWLIFGPLLFILNKSFLFLYLAVLLVYMFVIFFESIRLAGIKNTFYFSGIVIATHLLYGIRVLQGLSKSDLKSRYRK